MAGREARPGRPLSRLSGFAAKRFLPRAYGPGEALSVTTEDGVRLGGARLAGPPEPVASIVLVHGFSQSSRTPRVHAFAHLLARRAEVIVPDLRGHGTSGGLCTLGHYEPLDVAAAVAAASPGLPVVTVGISLGGAAVLLHGRGRAGGPDGRVAGVVSVSAPAWAGAWDTTATNRIRRYATSRAGRQIMARLIGTRVAAQCVPVPEPYDRAAAISPAFVLVVTTERDHYFGPEHPETIFRWAEEPKDLWTLPGPGHGSELLTPELADRLLEHVEAKVGAK
jgi:pimeloyl-ACP methyl ester carboxylesterase